VIDGYYATSKNITFSTSQGIGHVVVFDTDLDQDTSINASGVWTNFISNSNGDNDLVFAPDQQGYSSGYGNGWNGGNMAGTPQSSGTRAGRGFIIQENTTEAPPPIGDGNPGPDGDNIGPPYLADDEGSKPAGGNTVTITWDDADLDYYRVVKIRMVSVDLEEGDASFTFWEDNAQITTTSGALSDGILTQTEWSSLTGIAYTGGDHYANDLGTLEAVSDLGIAGFDEMRINLVGSGLFSGLEWTYVPEPGSFTGLLLILSALALRRARRHAA
jgi:hypothetical protein